MSDINSPRNPLPPGTGMIIAGLFGAIGIATALILWKAGAGWPVALLAWLLVPNGLLVTLFLLTTPPVPCQAPCPRAAARRTRHV